MSAAQRYDAMAPHDAMVAPRDPLCATQQVLVNGISELVKGLDKEGLAAVQRVLEGAVSSPF